MSRHQAVQGIHHQNRRKHETPSHEGNTHRHAVARPGHGHSPACPCRDGSGGTETELAEQRALINTLLAAQTSQKEAIDKIESHPAQTPAQASGNTINLPQGLTFYGTLDVNVANSNSGYGSKTTIGSGGMTASSIGIKGQKDILNGVRVVGEVEIGIDLSTGVVGNGASANGVNNGTASSGGFLGNGKSIVFPPGVCWSCHGYVWATHAGPPVLRLIRCRRHPGQRARPRFLW